MKINNIFKKLVKEDYYLITIFFVMTITIILKSYFNPSGYLSPDSIYYLSLAQNLLDSYSFYIYGWDMKLEFFAIWPVGYPILIFIVAKLTGLPVFLASKLLSILLIGLVLIFFRKLFNKNAYLYGLIFFSASLIEIYSFSWSETVFIFCLVWFSTSMYLLISNIKKNALIYLSILFSSLFLFLSRYIGAFSFGLIGLIGLYYFFIKKDNSKSIILISIALINLALMSLYLHHNFIESGYITGTPRSFAPQSNAHLLFMVINSFILEISFFSNNVIWKNIAYPILLIILLFIKYQKSIINQKTNKQFIILPSVFSSIGLVYLLFMIFLSWNGFIEELYYRLLAPGIFLIFIAIISYFENHLRPKYFNLFKILLLSISIYSWIINVPFQVYKDIKNPNYERINKFNIKYIYVKKEI
ncbi:MAG: hypothetical protein CVU08_10955 [Bacteroidetes bacterium HGW-Bacteroidetes-3]|jgi:hypothetical protein|nr:MAG: hypothetical protein CVU08_10955 [Bacteroidetes bacterium HGW-Bacteroidetes-3]